MTTRQNTDQGAGYDSSTQGSAPAPEKTSIVEDFIDIFYAPSTVFARRERSGYGLTLLIVTVVAALFTFAARDAITTALDADMSRRMAEQMAKNPQLTQEMVDRMRGTQTTISLYMMMVGTPVAIVVVAFLSWLSAKIVSAKITWQQAMLIVTLAWIPRLVSSLIVAVQGLLTDTSAMDSMMRLTFSPARFMSPETTPPLLAAATRFDVFVLWTTVLIGIGIAVMAKVPRSKGFGAAAIVWGLASAMAIVPALFQ